MKQTVAYLHHRRILRIVGTVLLAAILLYGLYWLVAGEKEKLPAQLRMVERTL